MTLSPSAKRALVRTANVILGLWLFVVLFAYFGLLKLTGVLGRNQPKAEAKAKLPKGDRKAAAKARDDARALKQKAAEAEAASAKLAALCSALDRAMFDPAVAEPESAALPMSVLASRRAKIAADLEAAEARWIEASEQLEKAA